MNGSSMNEGKASRYRELVDHRKKCYACSGLTNLARLDDGRFDSGDIGLWSLWQGNLDSSLMVVGQDWGDTECCRQNDGHEPPDNPTNETLRSLLASIGIRIEPPSRHDDGDGTLFFTNAILCLKTGGMQSKVNSDWFSNCGRRFLKPLVEIVQPKVLVTLSEPAYRAIAVELGLAQLPFRVSVETEDGFRIGELTTLHPAYHCGRRIMNTHRPLEKQLEDWARIGRTIARLSATNAMHSGQ
jgi:uracil-DNA glycosylase